MVSNLYEFGFQLHWSDLLKILPFTYGVIVNKQFQKEKAAD